MAAKVKASDRSATRGRLRAASDAAGSAEGKKEKLSRKEFEAELEKLAVELVKLQLWVQQEGLKIIIVFEGRDAAGRKMRYVALQI